MDKINAEPKTFFQLSLYISYYVGVEQTSRDLTRYHPLPKSIPPHLTTAAAACWRWRRIRAALDRIVAGTIATDVCSTGARGTRILADPRLPWRSARFWRRVVTRAALDGCVSGTVPRDISPTSARTACALVYTNFSWWFAGCRRWRRCTGVRATPDIICRRDSSPRYKFHQHRICLCPGRCPSCRVFCMSLAYRQNPYSTGDSQSELSGRHLQGLQSAKECSLIQEAEKNRGAVVTTKAWGCRRRVSRQSED